MDGEEAARHAELRAVEFRILVISCADPCLAKRQGGPLEVAVLNGRGGPNGCGNGQSSGTEDNPGPS